MAVIRDKPQTRNTTPHTCWRPMPDRDFAGLAQLLSVSRGRRSRHSREASACRLKQGTKAIRKDGKA